MTSQRIHTIRGDRIEVEASVQVRRCRQLIVGLDAMEWSLIVRWAREGKLPTFQRLIEEGTRAELATTAAQLPDTVWASLCTGLNPGKLEKFFYVQYDAKTLGLRHVTDEVINRPAIWDHLSRAGLRVGVVDVPKFPLSRSFDGYQLTNWGAHATSAQRRSTPASLLEEITKRFGHHPVGDCDAADDSPGALRRLRQRILEGVRAHGEIFRWLMNAQPWDVLFVAFSAPHCAGHHFWRFMDPTHIRHPKRDSAGLADTIEQVYRAIDGEVGALLALAGDDTRCLAVAGHGMGPIHHASWNLPEILDLLGYGRSSDGSTSSQRTRTARINPWRIVKMVVPGSLQYRVKAMLPQSLQDRLLFLWYAGGRTWSGCRAFAIPNNDSVGAIRVSVKGRDKGGLAEPGEEYRRVCRELAEALRELTDPESGRPVVSRVTITHEVFHGPFLDQLPDLTVLWDQSFPWTALHSPRFGTLRIRRQDARSGSHTPRGFALLTGPGIPVGAELAGGSIYDVTPTILDAAGVPLPPDLDGRPLSTRALTVPV